MINRKCDNCPRYYNTHERDYRSVCNKCWRELTGGDQMIKCKTCKDTGFVAQLGYDGEYEPDYCDCTIDPKYLEE